MVLPLRDYQVADLAFYLAKPRCLNLSDPGTGKTPSVCVYAQYLWQEEGIRTAWAMPKSLIKKNYNELLRFTELKPEDIAIVSGYGKKRRLEQMASDAKVFLFTFTGFSDEWSELVSFHPDVRALFVDEIHLGYKGDTSKRTQSLYQAMDTHFTHFLAMTGTIIDGRLSSAYPSIRIIEPDLYTSFNVFMIIHAIEDGYGRVLAWRNPEKLTQFFGRHAIRRTFEQVYGKEAKVIIHETCQMEERQREAYDEFAATALLELEESFLEGSLPGVNFIRARQLAEHPQSFGAPLDKIDYTGKEERLLIHLEDFKSKGTPFVIFSSLVPSQERCFEIARSMGLRVALINGSTSQARRGQIDEQFQRGELDGIIASPATAGVGFNWGHVDVMIFMNLDFLDSSFLQGYRRAIRGKRDKPLLIYVFEYEDSVDQRIFQIVETKSQMAANVHEDKEVLQLREKPKAKKPIKILGSGKVTMHDFLR
jgi:SNF2 family DNA or RNA helicase